MVPFNLKVLAKFECLLARARKIFPTACMLGFLLKLLCGETKHLGEKCTHSDYNTSRNMHPGFADVLLKLKHVTIIFF